jgi:hypothetical protein
VRLINSPVYIIRRSKITRASIVEARRCHYDAVEMLKLVLIYTFFLRLYAALSLPISALRCKNS